MVIDPHGDPASIRGLNVALDERDTPTDEHCDRVFGLALELGQQCGLSERELELLGLAARLHDVGKIGIPDSILKKPGKLDDQDWIVMKTHPDRSARIIVASGIENAELIARVARHHHERFDGKGYPDGLAGEAIPRLSRIIAIVDTYDAMARLRVYGPAQRHVAILDELRRVSGSQHDPDLTSRFLAIVETSRFRSPY